MVPSKLEAGPVERAPGQSALGPDASGATKREVPLPSLAGQRLLAERLLEVEVIGQLGGTVNAVAVQGPYAYVGVGPRLVIMDISDPASLRPVGQSLPMSDLVQGVSVSGDFAYVAAGSAGLQIFKVANPAFPVLAGSVDIGYAYTVALAGAYAYVAAGKFGLRIIDVTSPANPFEVGAYRPGGYVEKVVLAGIYGYVGTNFYEPAPYGTSTGDMRVLDLSNPTQPLEMSRFFSGIVNGLSVAGEYVYLGNSFSIHRALARSDLDIIGVSDPRKPVLAGTFQSPYPDVIADMSLVGNKIYLASNNLSIVDVSVPTAPAAIGTYQSSGLKRLAIAGSRAYAVKADGLEVVNVSDPVAPTKAGSYGWPQARRLTVAGRYAYVLSDYTTVRIFDLSDPHVPVELGSYQSPESIRDMAASGSYLFLANDPAHPGIPATLRIVDVANPSAPAAVAVYVRAGSSYFGLYQGTGLAVQGNYLYLAADGRTLRIIDISNAANPIEVGSFDLSSVGLVYGSVSNMAVHGNYAYLPTGGGNGLVIVDTSTPANPILASLIPGWSSNVAVQGRYAYLVTSSTSIQGEGLRVFDVSHPSKPVQVGSSPTTTGSLLSLAGGYLFVGEYGDVLRVMDVIDPANPKEVSVYRTQNRESHGLVSDGNYLYIGATLGFQVLHFSGAGPGPSIANLSVNVIAAETVHPGNPLSYVVMLDNSGPTDITVTLTNTIPANTSFIPGTLTGPTVYSDTVRSILWSGVVPPGTSSLPSVFFNYRVMVGDKLSASAVVNTVIVSDGSTTTMPRTATRVLLRRMFLPALIKGIVGW